MIRLIEVETATVQAGRSSVYRTCTGHGVTLRRARACEVCGWIHDDSARHVEECGGCGTCFAGATGSGRWICLPCVEQLRREAGPVGVGLVDLRGMHRRPVVTPPAYGGGH